MACYLLCCVVALSFRVCRVLALFSSVWATSCPAVCRSYMCVRCTGSFGCWGLCRVLPATAQNLIITTPRTSVIYFKPKIHKPNNPGRRVVSAYSCPTELISQYLDQIMSPFVKSLPSYIKDTNHALKTFRDFNFPGQNKLNFTMDITSLYTVIPNHEGLLALKYFF